MVRRVALLVIVLINALLVFTYFRKSSEIDQFNLMVRNAPPLDEYFELGHSVTQMFSEGSEHEPLADPLVRLNRALTVWDQSLITRSKDRANSVRGMSALFFDSLRSSIHDYQATAESLAATASKKRQTLRARYDQYSRLLAQRKELPYPVWKNKLDSLNNAYDYEVREYDRFTDFRTVLASLAYQSDPTEEFQLGVLLNQLNSLITSSGSFVLYGTTFTADNLTWVEERQLLHYISDLKYNIDKLLITLHSR